jgi:hypothetical protein
VHILKRLLGVVVCLLGLTGVVLCVAGIYGCWRAYSDLLQRSERLFSKSEKVLGEVRRDLTTVHDRLRETREQLDTVREREADFAAQPPEEQRRRRDRSRKQSEQLRDFRGLLVNSTEAALVVNGLLGSLAELPGDSRAGIDPEQLRDASDSLSDATDEANQLAVRLAPAGPLTPEEMERSARIAELLDRVIAAIEEGLNWTDRTQERVEEWQARSRRILLLSALAITVVLLWIGAAQFSLMVHGYSWARSKASASQPGGSGRT